MKRLDPSAKLPRNHAFIHMRNRGYGMDIDYEMVDSPEAKEMMEAACAILRRNMDKAKEMKA